LRGDIVRHFEGEKLIVLWSDKVCGFIAYEDTTLANRDDYWEVIGNIHDNPKLLHANNL
jgi:hypothetical protein